MAIPREASLIKKLFERFDQHLAARGYMARGGQIIDASIVPVPTQRNSRDENADPTRTCAQSVETFCPDCRAYRAKAS